MTLTPNQSRPAARRVRRSLTAGLLAAACTAIAACGSGASPTSTTASAKEFSADKPMKAVFLYDGTPQDGGWDQSWDTARQAVQKTFGSRVELEFKTKVPESTEAARVIDQAVQDGADLVIGISYGFGKYMTAAAKKHPGTRFYQYNWQSPADKNFSGVGLRTEDSYYLLGMAAAAVGEKGKLGVVGSFPIPALIREVNAFELGAKKINPKATVRAVFVNSWFDPQKDLQATKALTAGGVEVIGNLVGDQAIQRTAQDQGIPWVGDTTDTRTAAPATYVGLSSWTWKSELERVIGSVLDDSWRPGYRYVGISDGAITMAPWGAYYRSRATAAEQAEITKAQAAMERGELKVFDGPVTDATGKVRVPAGSTPSVADLEAMDYPVQGVSGIKTGN
ncbi:BMP family ABC transporter substrate-binding protein [Streptomyces sp. NBC_01373]|uniref:BMP family ABC transporter substrate-binding protein n=1 Tax=Streptomyces sp. NBC_01373 TaxID=2903843 RepID=UPI0022505BA5|nr:BMP family ABC transporter substrate-binding protein [Streptomyces sp. NBC_01373]MCX4698278.1 BMP family ABC transporter substrate-binding protein [Streptomyces sp. NBC_01373]